MTTFHLAQLNIATLKAPIDSPVLADFVANLDRINALAESSPGFVWRLKEDSGAPSANATALRLFGEDKIVNLSLWTDVASLQNFAFRTAHADVLKRRREWFEKMDEAYAVLWWVPAGHIPTEAEAGERLERFRRLGASAAAFSFREVFAPEL
jgi:hypothetical protein